MANLLLISKYAMVKYYYGKIYLSSDRGGVIIKYIITDL